jgi:hypothetical protein
MSFWFRRKDKQGRLHYFSVTIPLLVVVVVFGVLLAYLMPAMQWLRQYLK